MLSRVLRASAPAARVVSRRGMHASAISRADLIQDLYSSEIKSFKPRALTDKDAEGAVLKWTTPAAPKAPSEELQVSELDSYASSQVEVEQEAVSSADASAQADSSSSADWFPIEDSEALDAAH